MSIVKRLNHDIPRRSYLDQKNSVQWIDISIGQTQSSKMFMTIFLSPFPPQIYNKKNLADTENLLW